MQQNNMTTYQKGTWQIQQHETKQDKSLLWMHDWSLTWSANRGSHLNTTEKLALTELYLKNSKRTPAHTKRIYSQTCSVNIWVDLQQKCSKVEFIYFCPNCSFMHLYLYAHFFWCCSACYPAILRKLIQTTNLYTCVYTYVNIQIWL